MSEKPAHKKVCIFCNQILEFEAKSYAFPFYMWDTAHCTNCSHTVEYFFVQKGNSDRNFPIDCMEFCTISFKHHIDDKCYKIIYNLEKQLLFIYDVFSSPAYVYNPSVATSPYQPAIATTSTSSNHTRYPTSFSLPKPSYYPAPTSTTGIPYYYPVPSNQYNIKYVEQEVKLYERVMRAKDPFFLSPSNIEVKIRTILNFQ